MPVYEYSALDSRGKKTKGIIDADSPLSARNKLRGSDLFPVNIKESSSQIKVQQTGSTSVNTLLRRIKADEISTITRQLATLMSAGIPLVASLELLITQEVNPLLKKVLAQTKESVNEGNSLASSLTNHSKYFSQIYINMVTAGEASGSLDLVLERLAEFSENQEALKSKVISAILLSIFSSSPLCSPTDIIWTTTGGISLLFDNGAERLFPSLISSTALSISSATSILFTTLRTI